MGPASKVEERNKAHVADDSPQFNFATCHIDEEADLLKRVERDGQGGYDVRERIGVTEGSGNRSNHGAQVLEADEHAGISNNSESEPESLRAFLSHVANDHRRYNVVRNDGAEQKGDITHLCPAVEYERHQDEEWKTQPVQGRKGQHIVAEHREGQKKQDKDDGVKGQANTLLSEHCS